MIPIDSIPPEARQPGVLRGQIWIAPDFDELSAQEEADWFDAPADPSRTAADAADA